jgi:WD40 repeat protein
VFEIVYGPNGFLAAGKSAGGIVILDAKSGVSLQTISRPEGGSLSPLAFSRDGNRLFVARGENGISIYNLETGQDEQTLADPGSFGAWVVDRQHRRIAFGKSGTPSVWDLEKGECLVRFNADQGHQGGIACIAFSPDERYLATVGGWDDRTVKLWDVATGQLIFTLGRTHEWRSWSMKKSLIFLSDGQHLLTSGPASRMDVWDVSELTAGAFPVPEEPCQAESRDERKPRVANDSAPIRPATRLAVVLFTFLGAGFAGALVWMVGRLLPG